MLSLFFSVCKHTSLTADLSVINLVNFLQCLYLSFPLVYLLLLGKGYWQLELLL